MLLFMQRYFQRYFRTFYLLLTVMLGISLGNLAATGLGVYLSPPVLMLEDLSKEQTAPLKKPPLQEFDIILQRNIFDPNSQNAQSLASFEKPQQAEENSAAARTDLILLGTVAAGEGSLAMIQADKEIETYRMGDEVPGGGRIQEIDRNLVHIENSDGSIEVLSTYEKGRQKKAALPPQKRGSQIRAVSENSWIIPREEAEKARGNLNDLLKQARMEPKIVNGRTEGFVVKMLRRNSFLANLGIQRGDVVKQVNGMELDGPEKALQIFQQLREAKHISIGLLRNGKQLNFEYEVD
jgi:general secretion pathway protein C